MIHQNYTLIQYLRYMKDIEVKILSLDILQPLKCVISIPLLLFDKDFLDIFLKNTTNKIRSFKNFYSVNILPCKLDLNLSKKCDLSDFFEFSSSFFGLANFH